MSQNSTISFVAEQQVAIKELKGVTKSANASIAKGLVNQKYLNDLAQEELDADLDVVFTELKSAFKFKRKELTAHGPEDGMGWITTPFFVYEVSIVLHEEALRNATLRRSVREIGDADVITGPAFSGVFGNRFDRLEVVSQNTLDLEAIIDQIEDAESSEVDLDYDKDITHCTIGLNSMGTTIVVYPDAIQVKGPSDVTPADLVHSLFEIQESLKDALDLTAPLLKNSTG